MGAGVSVGMAGCGEAQPEDTPTTTPEDTPTTQPEKIPRGGKPIEGMSTPPSTLNPLTGGTAVESQVMRHIYSWGTTFHPKTQAFTPWAFKDWDLNPENVGSGKPTLVGNLRTDMTFNDGEPVTAEDIKFTVEYAKEQQAAGEVTASQFDAIEEVVVDSPQGSTVSYFLKQEDNGWFTQILGSIILPKHIWKDVADASNYSPRKTKEGLVGSGPLVLEDFSWENWFELTFRPNKEIPFPRADYVDWIHNDAPFLDGVRIEIFGSESALQQAVLEGDVTVAFGSFTVDQAAKATERDYLEVKDLPSKGWHHHDFNMRRVPLDDPAFRQLLVRMSDSKWIVETHKKGIGANAGSYVTPKSYEEWRPPEPTEIDEFEGIPVPDLRFPGDRGTFQLGENGVQEARGFLLNHDRAEHDYSFGEAVTDLTTAPDGKELYVNGKPLPEAHTDNDGNPNQGPLVMIYNPLEEDLSGARIAQRWVDVLQSVGIPVEGQTLSFSALVPKAAIQEDFDMFESTWTGQSVNNDHYQQLFSSQGADVESNSDIPKLNFMGYTGADDLITKQATMLDPEARKPIVKQVLAKIWSDAPTLVTHYDRIIQPVNTEFTGWTETAGGVLEVYGVRGSWLNVRKASE